MALSQIIKGSVPTGINPISSQKAKKASLYKPSPLTKRMNNPIPGKGIKKAVEMVLGESGNRGNGFKGEIFCKITFDIINGRIDLGSVLLNRSLSPCVVCLQPWTTPSL